MSSKAKTPDERFILALYEAAEASGEMDTLFNRYEIGKRVALNPKGVDAICKLLVQANFIKKGDGEEIYITKNGENLAIRVRDE